MKYFVVPLCMTQDFFVSSGGRGGVGQKSDYDVRQGVTVEADTPSDAAEQLWRIYQNIDEDHLAPDGGRSMMVGDLVNIVREQDGEYMGTYEVGSFGFRSLPEGVEQDRFEAV